MTFEKCLALAFSLMILGQAYLVRRFAGTWLFPACIFGLFWFGFTFIPLAILLQAASEPLAIAFLFLCAAAFSTGSLFFDWKAAFEKNARKRETAAPVYASTFLRNVFYMATLASLAFVVLNSLDQGFSLRDFFTDFYESATAFAVMRYTESLNTNIYGPLSIVCAYVGVILGGLVFRGVPTKKGRRLVLILSFLPSILVAVTQLSKGLLFLSVVFFCAGLLVHRLSMGSGQLLEKGSIKTLALYTSILIPVTAISIFARGLHSIEDSAELADAMMGHLAVYVCGHIYAFSDWFSFIIGKHSELSYAHEGATYGFYTFAPLFRLLGSHRELPIGIYDDLYSFGGVLDTNIFTLFRGLIQDFGLIGCVLFMFTAGILLHWAFHAMLRKRRPVFTVAVFVFMMGAFYMSFGLSLLIWNTMYVTFALVWMVLWINKRITQRGGRGMSPIEVTGGVGRRFESEPLQS